MNTPALPWRLLATTGPTDNVLHYLMRAKLLPLVPEDALGYWRHLWDWQADAQTAYARKTLEAFASDWASFVTFCRRYHRCPLPAEADTLALYILSHIRYIEQSVLLPEFAARIAAVEQRLAAAGIARAEPPLKIATLRRHLASIRKAHSAAGVPSNPAEAERVQLAMKTATRLADGRQTQAAPIRAPHLQAFAAQPCETPRAVQDLALALVARDTGVRGGALVSLNVEDITWCADGAAVLLFRIGKTDLSNQGRLKRIRPLAAGQLRAWLARAGITEGPVFRGLPGRDNRLASAPPDTRLTVHAARAALQRCMARIGCDTERIGTHSTRVGGLMDLLARGHSDLDIMRYGDWEGLRMPKRYGEQLHQERNPFEDED